MIGSVFVRQAGINETRCGMQSHYWQEVSRYQLTELRISSSDAPATWHSSFSRSIATRMSVFFTGGAFETVDSAFHSRKTHALGCIDHTYERRFSRASSIVAAEHDCATTIVIVITGSDRGAGVRAP